MPAYNYSCLNANCETQIFTLNRPMSEYKEKGECPECKEACERASNDFCKNFKLKGGGWFNTGYSTNAQQVGLEVEQRISRKNSGSGE